MFFLVSKMGIKEILLLYCLVILIFLVLYFIMNLKWCVNTLRRIAHPKNQGGYIKLIQIGIVSTLIITFLAILIYYLKYPSPVDKIDVVLTVVVGWLGLIIGRFFGERAMENLEERQNIGVRKLLNVKDEYKLKLHDSLSKLEEVLNRLKKK